MCIINRVVDGLKQEYAGYECRDKDEAEEQAKIAANKVLSTIDVFPVRMGKTLRTLGFEVWVKHFSKDSLSGVLAINANEEKKMVVGVNRKDSHEHQCFTLAHELAHYIFEVPIDSTEQYVNVHYDTSIDNEQNLTEYRANKFATYLLMPGTEFKNAVYQVKNEFKNSLIRREVLSRMFDVSEKAVERRLKELHLVA